MTYITFRIIMKLCITTRLTGSNTIVDSLLPFFGPDNFITSEDFLHLDI